jgi:hypothetical protein
MQLSMYVNLLLFPSFFDDVFSDVFVHVHAIQLPDTNGK